ncbi:MAG: NADH-quinone oxidoreductase subunit NuoK [Sandaracinaceae bacterium]
MISAIALGVLATLLLGSAVFVVRSKNLVHGVLGLGVTLSATAIVYAMLGASFLAGVQVLLYVGGVVTLMIFGVMVTRKHDGIAPTSESQSCGAACSAAAASSRCSPGASSRATCPRRRSARRPPRTTSRRPSSAPTFSPSRLSLLLLAAIVGAIVIARRRDFRRPPRAAPARPRRGGGAPERPLRLARGGHPRRRRHEPHRLPADRLGAFSGRGLRPATRKQLVAVLLSVELMANAANLVMVAFSHFTSNAVGQVFTLFALALTVAEVAVGLAIALLLYRTYASSNVDDAQEMKG